MPAKSANATFTPAEQRPRAAQALPPQRASVYTTHVLLELIDVNGKRANGARATVADASSLRHGRAGRHALTCFQKDAVAQMDVPAVPRGVTIGVQSLLGPTAAANPCGEASWAWVLGAYGDSAAAGKQAIKFVCDALTSTLEQGQLNVDLSVPASDTHGDFQVESRILTNRVEHTRSLTKLNQEPCTIKEIINLHIVVADNVPPAMLRGLEQLTKKYPTIVTRSQCKPGTSIRNTLGSTPSTPATPTVQKTIQKKPAALRKRPAAQI